MNDTRIARVVSTAIATAFCCLVVARGASAQMTLDVADDAMAPIIGSFQGRAKCCGLSGWESVRVVKKGANYGYSEHEGTRRLGPDGKDVDLPADDAA